ncbi:hypothetical protein B4U79_12676 [Dinothrombium tinctorium]|nr:hypothetical protein B4U79_12676 [Dinothrombium tinctorium]
MNSIIL